MKVTDFLQCTFEGDTTVYIAEVMSVQANSFSCRFVHSEKVYSFSTQPFKVLQTNGGFPVGTLLTSQEFYTNAHKSFAPGDTVVVTFANGKNYIESLLSIDPDTIQFFHEPHPIYSFKNNVITRSEGIYPVGQKILAINAFIKAGDVVTGQGNGAPIDLSKNGISLAGEAFNMIANNLQGNILKGHGRHFSNHVFFKFNANRIDEAKAFLKTFAEQKITSAFKQRADSEQINNEKRDARQSNRTPDLEPLQQFFYSVFLTKDGYQALQIESNGFDGTFSGGMQTFDQRTGDTITDTWDKAYQEEIHGMILIAWGGNDRAALDTETETVLSGLRDNNIITVLAIEKGNAIKNADNNPIEHFGYVDGISQPQFFTEEIMELASNGINTAHWNPLAALSLVLVKDPLAVQENSYGSYFVFRKLEQNVQAFKQAEITLDKTLFGENGSGKNMAGALMVGRFENGLPVTLSDLNDQIDGNKVSLDFAAQSNDFNYDNDKAGAKCPFHAHIRKSNPRGDTKASNEKAHRIVRRGITYNDNVTTEIPLNDAGLLFMCYQADIAMQFEFIQEFWANSANFSQPDVGTDAIIGIHSMLMEGVTQNYPKVYNDPNSVVKIPELKGFVTLKGGGYFFAPAISFFKELAP